MKGHANHKAFYVIKENLGEGNQGTALVEVRPRG